MKQKPEISNFSEHLFWDVKRSELDMDEDRAYIIRQVLEYGLMEDWRIIKEYYGIAGIAKEAVKFRTLDPVTLSFISTISHIPKEKFRCYNYQQSIPENIRFYK